MMFRTHWPTESCLCYRRPGVCGQGLGSNYFQPWIDDWAMLEICAGMEGKSAADAAYSTAILLEQCRLHDVEVSGGGAADVAERRRMMRKR